MDLKLNMHVEQTTYLNAFLQEQVLFVLFFDFLKNVVTCDIFDNFFQKGGS